MVRTPPMNPHHIMCGAAKRDGYTVELTEEQLPGRVLTSRLDVLMRALFPIQIHAFPCHSQGAKADDANPRAIDVAPKAAALARHGSAKSTALES